MLRKLALRYANHVIASRPYDEPVGNPDCPLIQRWFIVKNRWFKVYLHRLIRSDDDRALHDHRMANISWILDGSYREWLQVDPETIEKFQEMSVEVPDNGPALFFKPFVRSPGDVRLRRASTPHRLELDAPVTTFFIGGPVVREWGFHTLAGWVPWHKFVGREGKGC